VFVGRRFEEVEVIRYLVERVQQTARCQPTNVLDLQREKRDGQITS